MVAISYKKCYDETIRNGDYIQGGRNMTKRIVAMLLCLVMLLSSVPTMALATEAEEPVILETQAEEEPEQAEESAEAVEETAEVEEQTKETVEQTSEPSSHTKSRTLRSSSRGTKPMQNGPHGML